MLCFITALVYILFLHTEVALYLPYMQLFFTPTAIFIATCIGFLMGAIFYSPLLFKKAWLKGEGATHANLPKRTLAYLLQVNCYSLVAHGCIASVLAILFDLLQITTAKTAVILGLLLTLGFVVTTRFIDMVYTPEGKHWEMKTQLKFLVTSGYYLTVIGLMSWVLFIVRAF